jgi:cyclic pyranopterin phosphate synthase
VRRWLRADGLDDAALLERLATVWRGRADRYSELRTQQTAATKQKVEMSYIGG